ncbi:MAG: UDP-2,4-diacetamido-2,4,6-trideoxy-beta-L-altropyranose hydrolase [Desulfobulbaceae bacterium]
MKVAIRVDASIQIGSGHVMRCLTLAEVLREKGSEIVFVCRENAGHLSDFVENRGYHVFRLPQSARKFVPMEWNRHASWLSVPWEHDARQTIEVLRNEGEYDWLIVDHYALDRNWERLLRPLVKRIMVIDDLADRPHDCDLLLDQNLYPALENRYETLVSVDCEKLLGPKFALLRHEFVEARKSTTVRTGTVRRIFVFMGGSDPDNITGKALEALKELKQNNLQIDLVVGEQSIHRDALQRQCVSMPHIVWHENISDMAALMVKADLAVGAGGTTLWERACLGLPSLILSIADNQIGLAQTFGERGYGLYLGPANIVMAHEISQALTTMINSPSLLRHFSTASMQLIDGKGAERVLRRLARPDIKIRRAILDDCESIYQWRNAPEVRLNFFGPQPIRWEDHQQWFFRVLKDVNTVLLVGETDGTPVGVVRYDLVADKALVSIYLVPEKLGQGHGVPLLQAADQWLRQSYPGVWHIQAEILTNNEASRKIFLAAGYVAIHSVYRRSFEA